MKLKSLFLGTIAAAGLTTAGFAADLGVLTSLDVCDSLGLSGLTLSSDTNCLQITGGVSYELNWGDYKGDFNGLGVTRVSADDGLAGNPEGPIAPNFAPAVAAVQGLYVPAGGGAAVAFNAGDVVPAGALIARPAVAAAAANPDADKDWESQIEAWLKFVGTAESDFGSAKAVIRLKSINETRVVNETEISSDDDTGAGQNAFGINQDKGLWVMDEAYVSVGDTTVVMAGKKSSIANFGDDEPFNYTGLFNSSEVDAGVFYKEDNPRTGSVSIQVVSDLGNGVNVGLGLERIDRTASTGVAGGAAEAGTLVGVVGYAGEGITAHLTALAGGVLDGNIENYAMHAGFTGAFDAFKVRGAFAASRNVPLDQDYWNGLLSAEATFDLFKIALSAEATGGSVGGVDIGTDVGFGGSVGATVTDGIEINLGGRYYHDEASDIAGYQIAAQLVAAVTETIKLTGEIGLYGTDNDAVADQTDFYGAAGLAWAPGGGFTTSVRGEAHQDGAYRITYKAAKTFE